MHSQVEGNQLIFGDAGAGSVDLTTLLGIVCGSHGSTTLVLTVCRNRNREVHVQLESTQQRDALLQEIVAHTSQRLSEGTQGSSSGTEGSGTEASSTPSTEGERERQPSAWSLQRSNQVIIDGQRSMCTIKGGAGLLCAPMDPERNPNAGLTLWASVTNCPLELQFEGLGSQNGEDPVRALQCVLSSDNNVLVIADDTGCLRAFNATSATRVRHIGDEVVCRLPDHDNWLPGSITGIQNFGTGSEVWVRDPPGLMPEPHT